jgi:hypothetical protein
MRIWPPKQSKSKLQNWLINLLLLVLATALMLVLSEGMLRWLDGYQMSTLKLNQDNNAIPAPDQSR